MPNEPKDLLRKLEEVFGGLEVPSAEELVDLGAGDVAPRLEIRARLLGRHWRDLSLADLQGEAFLLAFLAPAGFRFLLPAFIRTAILNYPEANLVPMAVVWSLLPSESAAVEKQRLARIGLLSDQQREAVQDFLRFLQRHHREDFSPEEISQGMAALST